MLLSIIIPARNESRRLPTSLEKIAAFLAQQPYQAEMIVVDNGSTDGTGDLVQKFTAQHPHLSIQLLSEPTPGKGAAVRTGMLAGQGEILFICDADLSMPIEEVNKFLSPALDDYAVAIGSREGPGAVRYHEPFYRHWMGRVFNWIVRVLAVPGFQDTQCGFKAFRRDVARELFAAQTMTGWSFDVEVLHIAIRRGYKIVAVPIHWYYRPESRIAPISDSIRMFRDVWRIRQNGRRGRYAPQAEGRSARRKAEG